MTGKRDAFMRWLCVICGSVLVLFLFGPAIAEAPKAKQETVTIPREKIVFAWPGSRQFRDLEPEFFEYRDTPEKIAKYSTPEGIKEFARIIERANKESLVVAIERAMNAMPKGKDAKMGPGFAVEGQGRAALRGIYDVLVKGGTPRQHFPAGKELSLVFFSRSMQAGIRLESVTRTGEVFNISYALTSRAEQAMIWLLAIIPVGELRPGDYRVDLRRCRDKEPELNERGFPLIPVGVEKDLICQPFSFTVKADPASKGGAK